MVTGSAVANPHYWLYLLYGLVVFFFGYVAAAYRRSRQTDLQITTLARELALREALDRRTRDPGPDVR